MQLGRLGQYGINCLAQGQTKVVVCLFAVIHITKVILVYKL